MTPIGRDSWRNWIRALAVVVLTAVVGLPTTSSAFAVATSGYDASPYAYDAPALLSTLSAATTDSRGSPVGPVAMSGRTSASVVGFGVAANTGTARFVASSDGVVTDLVGSRNAISIGHYPEYVANAQATGARTFSMADDAWNAMSPTEQWARNQRFLDGAISRGSEIQLATPLDLSGRIVGFGAN